MYILRRVTKSFFQSLGITRLMCATRARHKEDRVHPEYVGSVLHPLTDISYRQISFKETYIYIKILLLFP